MHSTVAIAQPGQSAERAPLPVTDVRGTDSSRLLAPGPQRRQPLQGFDEDYVDIVDYIVRCTHKIWEEKNAGLIYTHYLHNSIVHSGDGAVYGREDIVQSTVQSIAAYPDELAFADDVVWTGNDQDGFYTSHRNTTIARTTHSSIIRFSRTKHRAMPVRCIRRLVAGP